MEIVDLETYNLNKASSHTSLCKFKRKFLLQNVCNDFKFVNINNKPVPFIYGLHLEQYDVDVILNKLNFHLKIVCSTSEHNGLIRNLKMKIYNTHRRKEIASCTNFLQRRKNLHLALNVLRKCSKLFDERKIVLQTLSEASLDHLTVVKTDDSGYFIRCLDTRRNFLFFESNWSIGWNYKSFDVFDFVDFMLNSKDKLFNTKIKPIMKNLTNPHNNLDLKLELWNQVLHCVQESLENNINQEQCVCNYIQNNLPRDTSRKRYKNLLENKEFYLIHPEIIEIIDSDEDVSMEIEESDDNDVEVVIQETVFANDAAVVCEMSGNVCQIENDCSKSIVIDG